LEPDVGSRPEKYYLKIASSMGLETSEDSSPTDQRLKICRLSFWPKFFPIIITSKNQAVKIDGQLLLYFGVNLSALN
jgi:hypothetical protein